MNGTATSTDDRLGYFRPRYIIPTLCRLGDVNDDVLVTPDDTAAFAAVMVNPDGASVFEICAADVNSDGELDENDIDPFIGCVLAGGCP